jgi:2-isopropylmalate synthase
VSAAKLRRIFLREYVRKAKWGLNKFRTKQINKQIFCNVDLSYKKRPIKISGYGNGPLDALVNALKTEKIKNLKVPNFEIANYKEHSLKSGTKASAISYTQIKTADGKTRWGAGVDTNIELASVKAVLSALNRLMPPTH